MSMAQIEDETSHCIHTLPMHMAESQNFKKYLYKPAVLSLGPYHYGKPEYSQMEELKKGVFKKFMEESVKKDPKMDEGFFYYRILRMIDEIRGNYPGIDKDMEDHVLAEIILKDACFLISYMDRSTSTSGDVIQKLGLSTAVFVECDLWRLENQIPFWIIKYLLDLRFGEEADGDRIVQYFLSYICFKDENELKKLPWKEEGRKQPLHLLDAYRTILLTPHKMQPNTQTQEQAQPKTQPAAADATQDAGAAQDAEAAADATQDAGAAQDAEAAADAVTTIEKRFEDISLPHRSVTYLKAKGIKFRASSCCLEDIRFTSHCVYGKLHVPILLVDHKTEAFFHNVVALEMNPGSSANTAVISYIDFMKSLIDTSEDVHILREKRILFSTLGSDEEVVKLFNGVETYGMTNRTIFEDVRRKINKHCNSKAKTWAADLYQNYLRTPWSIVAVCVTGIFLCLAILQTFYKIHSKN